MEHKVWVFFYGSYINPDVLDEVGLRFEQREVSILTGFDLIIAPHANLARDAAKVVWGVLSTFTHADLARLYNVTVR